MNHSFAVVCLVKQIPIRSTVLYYLSWSVQMQHKVTVTKYGHTPGAMAQLDCSELLQHGWFQACKDELASLGPERCK